MTPIKIKTSKTRSSSKRRNRTIMRYLIVTMISSLKVIKYVDYRFLSKKFRTIMQYRIQSTHPATQTKEVTNQKSSYIAKNWNCISDQELRRRSDIARKFKSNGEWKISESSTLTQWLNWFKIYRFREKIKK